MQILADQLIDNVEAFVAGKPQKRRAATRVERPRRRGDHEETAVPVRHRSLHRACSTRWSAMTAAPTASPAMPASRPTTSAPLVDGTIFTRGGKDKQNTAIFVGGGDMAKGEALFDAVQKHFFGPFRVSIMLDSNGSNTTAAAGVALLAKAQARSRARRPWCWPAPARSACARRPFSARKAPTVSLTVAVAGREPTRPPRRSRPASASRSSRSRRPMTPPAPRRSRMRTSCSPPAPSACSCCQGRRLAEQFQHRDARRRTTPSRRSASKASRPPTRARTAHGKLAFGALGIGGLKLKLHRALHRQAVRQLRRRVRCRGNLRAGERDGLMTDIKDTEIEQFLAALASRVPRRAAAAPRRSSAPWVRRWSAWCAT